MNRRELLQYRKVCLSAESRGVTMINLTFQVFEAEMIGLIGLNDAGKSSFIDLMLGQAEVTSGEILLQGAVYRPKSIQEANQRGVYHVSRHSKLINAFSPEENLSVVRGGLAGWRLAKRAGVLANLRELLHANGLAELSEREVAQMTQAEKYLLEIVKATLNGARLLLLSDIQYIFGQEEDYPHFNALLDNLQQRGVTIVSILSRFHKTLLHTDRTFIFSRGRLVKTLYREEIDRETLEHYLIAPENLNRLSYRSRFTNNGAELLRIEMLEMEGHVCEPISVFQGEVLGIYDDGTFGERLCRELFYEDTKSARVFFEGNQVRHGKYWKLFEYRVGLFPQYYNNMYYSNMTARENLLLMSYASLGSTAGFLRQRVIRYSMRQNRERLGFIDDQKLLYRMTHRERFRVLMEMNRLVRWRVIFVCNPTLYNDLVEAQLIYDYIGELCEANCAVILISSDVSELFGGLCDRVITVDEIGHVREISQIPL